jgi:hypothetical protein
MGKKYLIEVLDEDDNPSFFKQVINFIVNGSLLILAIIALFKCCG